MMSGKSVMVKLIEYCLSNVNDAQRDRLQNHDRIREYPCLEHCGICCDHAFLVIDGSLVSCQSHEQLLAKHAENGDRV